MPKRFRKPSAKPTIKKHPKQASKQAAKQAPKLAAKQASTQAAKQAAKQAVQQAAKQAPNKPRKKKVAVKQAGANTNTGARKGPGYGGARLQGLLLERARLMRRALHLRTCRALRGIRCTDAAMPRWSDEA